MLEDGAKDTIANVIARINKLRSLANNNQNEHEASAATVAAANLIDKFQLSEADLLIKGEITADPIEEASEPLYKTGRAMLWIGKLAVALCEHYGCTGYWDHVVDPMGVAAKNPKATRDSYKAFKMVGRKGDIEIVRYFFDWLQPVIVDLMKRNASGLGMSYSQNYACGVVDGIKNQLKVEHQRAQREAAATNQSTAMVFLNNRLDLSKNHLKNHGPKLIMKTSNLRNDNNAKALGVKAGESISLNKGINGASPNKHLK